MVMNPIIFHVNNHLKQIQEKELFFFQVSQLSTNPWTGIEKVPGMEKKQIHQPIDIG